MHQFSIPIISNAANPEKKLRDVFIGYLMVYLSYTILGVLGYLGFSGSFFYVDGKVNDPDNFNIKITQNFLNMFKYDAVPAIFGRLTIFCQLNCSYPLVNHF